MVAAHKTVAMLGVIGRAEDMHAILDAENTHTMGNLEAWFQTRGGRRGRAEVVTPTTGFVYATTRHGTSRAGDPSPHDHNLIGNITGMLDAIGGHKGLRNGMFAGTVEAATMVGRLHSAYVAVKLGYAIEPDPGPSGRLRHWRIKGIPREACEVVSKRSDEIGEYLSDQGYVGYRAAAMVLTKLGELDLAWMAADRGLLAAQRSEDQAVLGSLCRSVVHTLQSHGRARAATQLADRTADNMRRQLTPTSQRAASVYGTLLLAGAMASARAGDRQATHDYLDEADFYARQVGHDANHLWTAFGPTNVAIHRVATSVALGDMGKAHGCSAGIDATRLPLERRVRYAFDLARTHIERRETDDAVDEMLAAERLAPEQVHHHLMSRQIIADLRRTTKGERGNELAQLAERVQAADYLALGSAR